MFTNRHIARTEQSQGWTTPRQPLETLPEHLLQIDVPKGPHRLPVGLLCMHKC